MRRSQAVFQSTLPSQGATDYVQMYAESLAFQSTLPSQGATSSYPFSRSYSSFQSTLPSQGATPLTAPTTSPIDISIHAPLTGSDSTAPTQTLHHKISIHAPLTGSDSSASASLPVAYIFQSTLPSQGATLRGGGILHRGKYFNPRSPHRERQHFHFMRSVIKAISIHAPLTGSDDRTRKLPNAPPHISIHAPLTGSDDTWIATTHKAINFNPRSPHRERPLRSSTLSNRTNFNPRSPHRERRLVNTRWMMCARFQSTLPSQGATYNEDETSRVEFISIHAPLTGSDRTSSK